MLKGGRGEKGETDKVHDRPVDDMPFYEQMYRHVLRIQHTRTYQDCRETLLTNRLRTTEPSAREQTLTRKGRVAELYWSTNSCRW